jgi:enoyl-CoA hydratase
MLAYKIEKMDDGFLIFSINRPEKRNAINEAVMEGLRGAIEQAKAPEYKALIITGQGDRAFCSGGDLSVFHLLHTKEEAYPMLMKMANILYSLTVLPKPTIALINGTSIGGGCELAAACDFRLARKGIKAGFVQGKQAITTGWGGGSILSEKLPSSIAMKLLMEAELHPAEELKELGFIDALYDGDSLSACQSFFERIFANDPKVAESYKMLWVRKWTESSLKERIAAEVQTCARLWESDAHHGHVRSFINKRL